ncbi:MAG: hypothetical protein IJT80_03335 [Lachnospiraceae bacterium]|nr:hypothetical protein [Lachnospiraceae bacterium]
MLNIHFGRVENAFYGRHGSRPFRIRIDNTGEIVENIRDYTFAALDILNAEDYDEG